MPAIGWILLSVVALFPFFLMASLSHDRLVRRLYDLHREEWKSAGSPPGFFWRPPEGMSPTALPAFIKSTMTWAFRPPPALANDPEARRTLRFLRLGLIVWNVGGLALFGFAVVHFPDFFPHF